MAANPAYIGSSGIAAEAAGAGAGWKADPMEDVRDMFTTLGMIITQRGDMINPHNLTSMDNFDYIMVDNVRSFIKVWNKNSLSVATEVCIPIQHKLQGFFYWYHHHRKKGMIPVAADFDVTAMRLAVNEFDAEIQAMD